MGYIEGMFRVCAAVWLLAGVLAFPAAPQQPLFAVKMLRAPLAPVEALVKELRAAGVKAVYCRSDDLFTDPVAGRNLREFRRLLREAGIAFHITAPVFLDTAAIARDPSLAGIGHLGNTSREPGVAWLGFVCPARPDYRRRRLDDMIAKVRDLRPDGLSLDFIRYFIYWERVKPDQPADSLEKFCFCDYCLERMQADLDLQFPAGATTRQAKAAWVLANHRERWTAWKCETITSMVRDAAREARAALPGLRISLHGVPWLEADYEGGRRVVAGQDLQQLAPYVDVFSPMCYFQMLGREPGWVRDIVSEYGRLTGKPPLPSVQAGGSRDAVLTLDAFRRHVRAALEPPSLGVNVFNWDRLKADGEKLSALRELLAER
jgi:hypothetical protein